MEQSATEQRLIDATSLIRKHLGHIERTFFIKPKTIDAALYDCEVGLNGMSSQLGRYLDGATAESDIQELFAGAIKEGVEYHRKICGTHSFNDEVLLSCGSTPCQTTLDSVAISKDDSLTVGEAEILRRVFANSKSNNSNLPYTADNLVALAFGST